jgi:short-subunit dehydrogenase
MTNWLITGVSSGFGLELARAALARGDTVVGTVRQAAQADRFEQLAPGRAHALLLDVTRIDQVEPAVQKALKLAGTIDVLVNNAGYGVPGSYVNVTWPDHSRFMQVMVTAVLDLTYRLLPPMLERGWGRVINIASVAGMVPSPAGHTLYGASKAFLIRFSEALSSENASKGVHVTAVCPGFTYSEFHDVTGTRDKMNKVPGLLWLTAREVAQEGYDAVMRGDPVVVNGRIYRLLVWLNGALPRPVARWVSGMAGRRYRKT